jgi:hypothetical protein
MRLNLFSRTFPPDARRHGLEVPRTDSLKGGHKFKPPNRVTLSYPPIPPTFP